ncbi:hypothetical protein [Rhodococcus sp. 1168]|uniref:hypothetical protein n=1 Tax=Rhodococcus sp. 1168 TaxID=2018041 RepID=UPI000A0C07EA|nr:hypothetical protein [Rhodococcus sp. 1168]ORI26015.1 hypothetical protein BJI47_01015 [Rhodococcus sp. 1168]
MTDDESLLASLGVTSALPPLPDAVWDRILEVALDPTSDIIDTDLVPEQDDLPAMPVDEDIVLIDDDDHEEGTEGDVVLDDAIPTHIDTSDGGHRQFTDDDNPVDDLVDLSPYEPDINPAIEDHGPEIHHDQGHSDTDL